jgi:hypothetical protein
MILARKPNPTYKGEELISALDTVAIYCQLRGLQTNRAEDFLSVLNQVYKPSLN